MTSERPLTIAWISDFGIEWLPDLPEPLRALPRQHPLSWQRVLLSELQPSPGVRLHVIVLRKNAPAGATFVRDGVTFHVLKIPGGLRAPTLFWLDTLAVRRVLRAVQPDLVHAWGTERGAALVAGRLGYPYLVTIQGLISWYRQLVPMERYYYLAAWIEKFSLPRAPLVTTESTAAVNFLRTRFPRLPVWQVEHAADWVFHRLARQPQTKPIRLIFVGVLCHRKGGDLLVAALDRLRASLDFELRIIGEAEPAFLHHLQSVSSSEIWRRIEIKRGLTPAQVAEELSRAAMMVFPTRADTSPNAVKEAAVAGVPVVASAVGGILDYISPGKNGLLFPSGDASACAAAIQEACRHPLFGQGMVDTQMLEKVRAYLSPTAMGERFLAAYQALSSGIGSIPNQPCFSTPAGGENLPK